MESKLHIQVSGNPDAPSVVFLHGFLGSGDDWAPIVDQLADNWHCVSIDLPGHGKTPIEPFKEFDDVPRAICELMCQLGADAFHVVGYSMGGRIGFSLMKDHAPHVISAFIISAFPGYELESHRLKRIGEDEQLARTLEEDGLSKFLDDWYDLPLFRALHWHPEEFAAMLKRRRTNDPLQLAEALRLFSVGRMPNCWEMFDNLNTRLCYIAGDVDDKYSDVAEELNFICPDAYVAIIPGCGHTIHVEAPEQVSDELRRWLNLGEEDLLYDPD